MCSLPWSNTSIATEIGVMVESNTYIKNKLTPQDPSALDSFAMEWSSTARIYSAMLGRFLSKFRVDWLVYQWNGSIDHLPFDAKSAPGIWVPASEASINVLFAADGSRRRRFLRFLHSDCIGLFLVRDGQWIAYCWSAQPGHKGRPPPICRGRSPARGATGSSIATHAAPSAVKASSSASLQSSFR